MFRTYHHNREAGVHACTFELCGYSLHSTQRQLQLSKQGSPMYISDTSTQFSVHELQPVAFIDYTRSLSITELRITKTRHLRFNYRWANRSSDSCSSQCWCVRCVKRDGRFAHRCSSMIGLCMI